MKSLKIYLSILVFLSFGAANAQEESNYEKGDLLLNGGISFGYYGYGYLGTRSRGMVPVTASLEYSINDKLGVGPYAGYANWNYTYTNSDYSWTFLAFGARGSFHATTLLNDLLDTGMDPNELDIYLAVLLGLDIRSYSGEGNVYTDNSSVNLILGPVLGVRYFFSDSFGVYLEGGRGAFGFGTLGVSFKF